MREIDLIVIHCSDSDAPNQTAATIRDFHVNVRGWKDIAYHWVIRTDGMIEQGRSEETPGAHVAGHNKNSIGICLVGRTNFTREQFRSLEALLGPMKKRYPAARLAGHREFNPNKTCPIFDTAPIAEFWNNLERENA